MPIRCPSRIVIVITATLLPGLFWLPSIAGPATPQSPGIVAGQCQMSRVDRSHVLPDVMFNVRLPPFGDVCFLGRHIFVPDDPDHSTVIGFELWHDGVRVYNLPRPDNDLWPPACDGIRAVAFPAQDKRRNIIVIGNCLGASDEQPQPLVYRATEDGFRLDADLSTDLMGTGAIEKIEQRMLQIPQG